MGGDGWWFFILTVSKLLQSLLALGVFVRLKVSIINGVIEVLPKVGSSVHQRMDLTSISLPLVVWFRPTWEVFKELAVRRSMHSTYVEAVQTQWNLTRVSPALNLHAEESRHLPTLGDVHPGPQQSTLISPGVGLKWPLFSMCLRNLCCCSCPRLWGAVQLSSAPLVWRDVTCACLHMFNWNTFTCVCVCVCVCVSLCVCVASGHLL